MRRTLLAAAILTSATVVTSGCGLTSRDRVNSMKRMNQGVELSKKKNLNGAEKALQEAVAIDKTNAAAHANLGRIYRKQRKWVDAEKSFLAAIENMADAPDGKYYYELAVVQSAQGKADGVTTQEKETKYREAIASFQEALKLNPKLYKAHYRTARLHEELDEPDKADGEYRKTIELKPTFSPAFVDLGNMYIDYGFANTAMVVLETGTQVNDKDARMWNGLGRAHLALNKPQEAVDAFTKAKVIDPDMPDVLFGLGMAHAELRMRKEAIENLDLFLQKADSNTPEDRVKAARDTVARMQDVI